MLFTQLRRYCIFFLFITVNKTTQAQRIDSLVDILGASYPQEKIHLHFDKSHYRAGETIWFKAYLAADNLPAAISRSLYADLLDETGKVLQRKMMPVQQSCAAGNFDLPDTIRSAQLFIRAYTPWMLNFDSSLLYLKRVQIIPAGKATTQSLPAATYSLQFFPEGGDLINGISSRVAFKASDNHGNPIAVAGDIMDGNDKKIARFSSVHDGMNYFVLIPWTGERYKAVWKDIDNYPHESPLPETKAKGAVLSTHLAGNQLNFTITRPDSVDAAYTSYYALAQMQQKTVYSAMINMAKKTSVTGLIMTDSLASGVLQLTIFNAARVPVAERLVFINRHNYAFATDVRPVEKNMDKRGRNSLQLAVNDTLLSDLSMSITDADINPSILHEENIYSELLLSSELRGFVYNPSYYFSADADSITQHLDLVMMTNGWRRFKWKDVIAGNWPVIKNVPQQYLSVSGKISGLSKKMLHGKTITGIVRTSKNGGTVLNLPISDQGEFGQDGLLFFDTAKIFYQVNNDREKYFTNTGSFAFSNNFLPAPAPPFDLLSSLYQPQNTAEKVLQKTTELVALQQVDEKKRGVKTLDTVTFRSRVKSVAERMNEEFTAGAFTSDDGYTFVAKDDPFAKVSPNVLFYLSGRAMGGLQINMQGAGGATWHGAAVSFYLNEEIVPAEMLKSINMSEVSLIKIFRGPFYGRIGSGGGGGIAIYTRTKKGLIDNSDLKGLPVAKINGYSVEKEFYSPDYEKTPVQDTNDYRTTLYWNPHLYFDKDTKQVTIPFFNSDRCKKMRVVVEGINESGLLTRKEIMIE